jgi:hypothetical protein
MLSYKKSVQGFAVCNDTAGIFYGKKEIHYKLIGNLLDERKNENNPNELT